MKVLVVDLETTGLSSKNDAIVELGIVLVDTKTGETEKVFDQIIKHAGKWNSFKHKHSWIFQNTTLTPQEVSAANPLEDYREEIQGWFDKYKVTAFNLPFDSRFLTEAEFKFTKTKCIMSSAHPHSEKIDKRGGRKKPSVQEIYRQFFMKGNPDDYNEHHRAGQDALDEAKILLHLVDLKLKGVTPEPLSESEKKRNVVGKKTTVTDGKSKAPQTNYPKYKPVGPHDKFPFVKHKDKLFSDLLKEAPKYINWCVANVKGFELTDEAKKMLE